MTAQQTTTIPSTTGEVSKLLADHGHRLTQPRRAVVETILRHDRPFSAEQIVAESPSIGRATVYRTLELLASVDVLTRILTADGRPAYVAGSPGHRHHLVCSSCGATVAFTACPVEQLVEDLSATTDFAIVGHHLEVFGVCPECRPVVAQPTN